MSKIAYRYGHNFACPGAKGKLDETTENRRYGKRVIELLKQAGHELIDCTPPDIAGTGNDLEYGVTKCNEANADFYISFHMNKAYDTYNGFIGSEVWIYSDGNRQLKPMGETILANLQEYGLKNRGVKLSSGLYDVKYPLCPAMIIELLFIEATEDVNIYNTKFEELCRAVAEGINGASIPEVNNQLPEGFTEEGYLVCNDDIRLAVEQGLIPSGTWHWLVQGFMEGRQYIPVIPEVEVKTPIISSSKSCVEQMQAWAESKGAAQLFIDLAPLFYKICTASGVNPEATYCQSAKETNYGRFGGVLDATYNNPCGMKNSSGGGDYDPNAHKHFDSWEQGIQAMVDHLCLYAGADGYPKTDSPDPRHFSFLFGTAANYEDLTRWSSNTDYGYRVVEMMKELLQTPYEIKPKHYYVETQIFEGWCDALPLYNKYLTPSQKLYPYGKGEGQVVYATEYLPLETCQSIVNALVTDGIQAKIVEE